MAANKFYSYYLRGGQIALIEQDIDDNSRWKSPVATVTDGLEIEYAYSPRYSTDAVSSFESNTFYINGWTASEGYLTFLRSHSASVTNWDASPYSAIADEEYIVVKGSSRWNGLHKVKTGGTDGSIVTYTKVNKTVPFISGSSNIDITAEEDTDSDGTADRSRIAANNGSKIWLNNTFSTGDYIFISGSEQAVNNGFWEISAVQADASNEIDSGIYIKNRYYCYDAANTISTEGIDTSPDTYATYDESIYIYKAYRDFCYIQGDINVLNDETDTIDLPEYLAKALVYYVKAKMAEDQRDIELKVYFMREFRKMVEKQESSKIWGARLVVPSSNAIR